MRKVLLSCFVLSLLTVPDSSNASFFRKSTQKKQPELAPSGSMRSSMHGAYVYVNNLLTSLTSGLHCNQFTCGRESGSSSWHKSIGCLLDGKLHPNCWKKILKEITAIDAGKVKKGTFFAGYESLPPHVKEYLKLLIASKIHRQKEDEKIIQDFILSFLEKKQMLVPADVKKSWDASGKHYLGQVYEVEKGRATIGQVIFVAPGYESALGGIFVIHPDKAKPLELSVEEGASSKGLYVAADVLLDPKEKKIAKIAAKLSKQYFGIGANYLLSTYQKI